MTQSKSYTACLKHPLHHFIPFVGCSSPGSLLRGKERAFPGRTKRDALWSCPKRQIADRDGGIGKGCIRIEKHSWDYPVPGAASLSLLFQFKPQKSPELHMLFLSPDEEMGYTEANSWTKVLQLLSEVMKIVSPRLTQNSVLRSQS